MRFIDVRGRHGVGNALGRVRDLAGIVTGESLTATVTLLFCDLVESTALASELGDAAADALRHDVFDALRAEVTAHRGTEVKNLGDGLMVSFTSNNDAVRAACGMQQAIDVLGADASTAARAAGRHLGR